MPYLLYAWGYLPGGVGKRDLVSLGFLPLRHLPARQGASAVLRLRQLPAPLVQGGLQVFPHFRTGENRHLFPAPLPYEGMQIVGGLSLEE